MERYGFHHKFHKKIERGNIIYLVCTKHGYKNEKCKGKTKFDRKTGKVFIYIKCINYKNLHTTITYEEFKNYYINLNYYTIILKYSKNNINI